MTSLVALVHRSNPDAARTAFSPKCMNHGENGATKSDPTTVENLDIHVLHVLSEGCQLVTSGHETFTERVLSFLIAHHA